MGSLGVPSTRAQRPMVLSQPTMVLRTQVWSWGGAAGSGDGVREGQRGAGGDTLTLPGVSPTYVQRGPVQHDGLAHTHAGSHRHPLPDGDVGAQLRGQREAMSSGNGVLGPAGPPGTHHCRAVDGGRGVDVDVPCNTGRGRGWVSGAGCTPWSPSCTGQLPGPLGGGEWQGGTSDDGASGFVLGQPLGVGFAVLVEVEAAGVDSRAGGQRARLLVWLRG